MSLGAQRKRNTGSRSLLLPSQSPAGSSRPSMPISSSVQFDEIQGNACYPLLELSGRTLLLHSSAGPHDLSSFPQVRIN
jgi:hypothetical protein